VPDIDLTFRPAVGDDAPAITELVRTAYRGDDSRAGWTTEADLLTGGRVELDQVVDKIDGPDRAVLLAAAPHDGLIGCCEVTYHGDGVAYFGMFAVRPTAQAGGLGRRLLAEAERYAARRWGATVMEMTVIGQRTELLDWYVRRGYTRTAETRPFPYDDRRNGVPLRDDLYFAVLTKDLPPVDVPPVDVPPVA
jgi:ribosomal protein S18 acetylase RimI-like enzyme